MKERIELNDTAITMMMKMSEGNPGALNVLTKILEDGAKIDPDDFMGSYGAIFRLDTLGIYGSRIWMLYKDVCKHDIVATLGVLRASQLGIVKRSILNHAIDNSGDGLDVQDALDKVKTELPNFAFANKT
jgi:hypothetical protein